MKMVMAVVPTNAADRVLDALVNAGHTATYAQTHGGMLQQSQYSLFIVVKNDQLDDILMIIKNNCHTRVEMSTHATGDHKSTETPPVSAELGGAIAFVWDINQVETF